MPEEPAPWPPRPPSDVDDTLTWQRDWLAAQSRRGQRRLARAVLDQHGLAAEDRAGTDYLHREEMAGLLVLACRR